MAQVCIRITSRPAGGAPAEIRDKWIGVVLPVINKSNDLLADVITGKLVTDRIGGYAVLWEDAMSALGSYNPEAREWWQKHVGRLRFLTLIFNEGCCEIIPD